MDFDMAPSVIWARDLYDQMQIRSDFRKWFPRMCQYGFVEGRDYEFVPRVRPQDEGGRTVQRYVKDYRITLEMAKQLYKLHHFHKNDCFRSCEGQHCMGTDHWMQAVIELLHQHKCKSHAPPKRFYESQPPDSLVTTTQIAKEYGCGAKVFNRLLHLHGIQYRANNQWVLYGCAGTWMATEECVVESQHFFLMQHEVYKEKAPNVIVDASGKLVSTEIRKGLDEDARKKILD